MTRRLHLNKSGSGWSSKTACGRNMLRTPISGNWEEFKNEPECNQCEKCRTSKQADLNRRVDAKNEKSELEGWTPEAPGAWMTADDAIVAAHKAK